MSAHTPGPFRVGTRKSWSASIPIFADSKNSGIPVGWASRVAKGGDAEAEANADLFAAAPDLLAALERCGCQDGGSCPNTPDGDCFVCAAIRKARGGK